MSTALYRYYNLKDELIYVGISNNPVNRASEHKREKTWFTEIRRITVDWFDRRESALEAEKTAIQKYSPKYNIVHNHNKPTVVKPDRITWRCEVCLKPVDDNEGYILISAREYRAEEEKRRKRNRDKVSADIARELTEVGLTERQKLVNSIRYYSECENDEYSWANWHTYHIRCDPNPDTDKYTAPEEYVINIERIRTPRQFIKWTHHLEKKSWLSSTNWYELAAYVAYENGEPT